MSINPKAAAALALHRFGRGSARSPQWRPIRAPPFAIIIEFGRTARIDGTDHGTATVALLTGGAR